MKGLGASKLFAIGAALGICEIIMFQSQHAIVETTTHAVEVRPLLARALFIEHCASASSQAIFICANIHFLFCVVSSYVWYSSRARKPIRDLRTRLRLAGYAAGPFLMMLACYYEFHVEVCAGEPRRMLLLSQSIGLYLMPILINLTTVVLGFFVAIILYALLNRRDIASGEAVTTGRHS